MNNFVNMHQKGKAIDYSSYISTTFAERYNDISNVEIHILDSKNGADISIINPAESEVIYPRNSKFEVLQKEKIDGIWHIYLKEV